MKHILNFNFVTSFCIIGSLLLVSSCSNLSIYSPNETKELNSHKQQLEEVFRPSFLTRVEDKLVFASYGTDKMLFVYSIPDLKFLGSTGRKGKGPDEIDAFPMFCESNNESLYVWGYTRKSIRKFNVTKDGNLIKDTIITLPEYKAYNNMHIVNDSLFIYYLPDELKVVKSNLWNGLQLDDIEMKKDDHNETFFFKNRGTIAANDSFLVYGYVYKKQIDIYRIRNFKLFKQIVGDYPRKDPIIGDFDNRSYYHKIVAGEKYFYALYNSIEKNRSILEVYDFNGVFEKELVLDIKPELFTIDEAIRSIYGYSIDSIGEPSLFRFDF